MRTTLLPIAALLLGVQVNAQLTAGEIPNGMTALDLNIDIALTATFTSDSADIEVDCDDQPDIRAVLHHGYPAIDAPNYAMLRFVDVDIEVCQDLFTGSQQRPAYYNYGNPLVCSDGFTWQSAAQLVLGDLGTLTAIGPAVIDSMYIAYRQDGIPGWILLSFDLTDDAEINLQVHTVLSVCGGSTSIVQPERQPTVTLFPNPSNGGTVRVESSDVLRSIEVLDPSGRILSRHSGLNRTINPPDAAGTYTVRIHHADGRRSVTRLVRF